MASLTPRAAVLFPGCGRRTMRSLVRVRWLAACTIVVVLLGGAVAAPVMPLVDVPLFRLRCHVESVSGPPGSSAAPGGGAR